MYLFHFRPKTSRTSGSPQPRRILVDPVADTSFAVVEGDGCGLGHNIGQGHGGQRRAKGRFGLLERGGEIAGPGAFAGGGAVLTPMPGKLTAPRDGVVDAVGAEVGAQVPDGEVLAALEEG